MSTFSFDQSDLTILTLPQGSIICSVNCPCQNEHDCTGEWALNLIEYERRKAKNWPEDATHENGNYFCMCCQCHETFIGHKRRVICKICSDLINVQYNL